jgi:methylated-DNA-protein-cysteine methyltransferase-like protein
LIKQEKEVLADNAQPKRKTYRDLVAALVSQIPSGMVASYGQIAEKIPGCTARMVGYALAALPENSDVPWQRVINYKGGISPRAGGFGAEMQRALLEEEGVRFNADHRINFEIYGWLGKP